MLKRLNLEQADVALISGERNKCIVYIPNIESSISELQEPIRANEIELNSGGA